jgi:uncharacterized membrane protein
MKERVALTENVVRYGTAALVCFTIVVVPLTAYWMWQRSEFDRAGE